MNWVDAMAFVVSRYGESDSNIKPHQWQIGHARSHGWISFKPTVMNQEIRRPKQYHMNVPVYGRVLSKNSDVEGIKKHQPAKTFTRKHCINDSCSIITNSWREIRLRRLRTWECHMNGFCVVYPTLWTDVKERKPWEDRASYAWRTLVCFTQNIAVTNELNARIKGRVVKAWITAHLGDYSILNG